MTLIAITVSSGPVQRSRYLPFEQSFGLLGLFFAVASLVLGDHRPVALGHVIDFKSDSIRSAEERNRLVVFYSYQMSCYYEAVKALFGQSTQIDIYFLDDMGNVNIVGVQPLQLFPYCSGPQKPALTQL